MLVILNLQYATFYQGDTPVHRSTASIRKTILSSVADVYKDYLEEIDEYREYIELLRSEVDHD